MVKKIFTLLALITVLPARSKPEQPMTENAPVLTVCQVLSNAFLYDGKFIRIRDRVVSTEEGSWLKSDQCPGVFKTDDYVWASMVSIAAPGLPLQIHPVDFEFDAASQRRVDLAHDKLTRSVPEKCIQWTYAGVFETRREWTMMRNGKPRGFGHLNAAPAQLISKSVDGVSPIDGCVPSR